MRLGRPPTYALEAVLDAAMLRFWALGYQATSLNDLVDATSLSRSSIYQTFGSKRDFFIRCLEHYQDLTTAELQRRLHNAASGSAFVTEVLNWVIGEAHSGTAPRGCLIMNTATEIAQRDPLVAAAVGRGLCRYRSIFLEAVRRGQEDGSISSQTGPALIADYLVTTMGGLRTMVKAGTPYSSLKRLVELIVHALD